MTTVEEVEHRVGLDHNGVSGAVLDSAAAPLAA